VELVQLSEQVLLDCVRACARHRSGVRRP